MLTEVAIENCDAQKEKIQDIILAWKGEEEQTDDILLVGIRV